MLSRTQPLTPIYPYTQSTGICIFIKLIIVMSTFKRQLVAIMFTDVVGYSALMGKDEHLALEVLKKNKEIHQKLIAEFNGKFLKELGDGILGSFNSASEAVYCAGAILEAAKEISNLNLSIGIHLGEVLFEDGDIFGDGVNVAARIQAKAAQDSIWISQPVSENVKNKPGVEVHFVDEFELKNIENSVRVYDVRIDHNALEKVKVEFSTGQEDNLQAPTNVTSGILLVLSYLGGGWILWLLMNYFITQFYISHFWSQILLILR